MHSTPVMHPEFPASARLQQSPGRRDSDPFEIPDVCTWFEAHARRSPAATAIRARGASVSYAELDARSGRIACRLRELGAGPDMLVGVCTDRSADMVVALLGVLRAGAAYVPLDPAYPRERLGFMLADAGVCALVTQSRWMGALPEIRVPSVLLDCERTAAQGDGRRAGGEAGPDHLAYVIYTSGSTGKPKGVAISRAAFGNFLRDMQRALEVTREDAVLALTTVCFDIAGLEVFLPLAVGGTIVLASREDAMDAARLVRLIEDERVTFVQATPATWRMILDSPWPGRRGLRILCGGEAMSRELADRLLARSDVVWNMYGPTETTVWSTLCRIAPGPSAVSIGRPIARTEVHILDGDARPVASGQVGELHIGGVGLARGYLNRPELTAEKFIPDPFSRTPGARLYRTGDLARFLPDGSIECLGRVDHQVKVRGFRIELPEIEARLASHPGVAACAVVARDDDHGDKYLSAYWVSRGEDVSPATTDELRRFLATSLPGHMVPSVFVRMDSLPLTPNGKIDRKALPAPDRALLSSSAPAPPTTETQRRLLDIWQRLLGTGPIGVRDDFFSLGGHSLAAARIVSKIESEMGVTVPLATFLSSPSVEQLAAVLDGRTAEQRSGITIPFREHGRRPPLFLVAGVGGHVFIFRELAELLGDDQPVYGLQGIGLDGKEAPLSRMEDIAARYVREVRSTCPEGPYCISGWSMGGVIAFEMARQMLAAGLPLARLVVIDACAPWAGSLPDRLRIHWNAFRRRSGRGKLAYLRQRLTHQAEALGRRLGFDRRAEGLQGTTADRVRTSSLAQFEALRRYRPGRLAEGMALLRAEQTDAIRDPRAADPHLGWRCLVEGKIEVAPLAGSHTGIFVGQNVRTLAAALGTALGGG